MTRHSFYHFETRSLLFFYASRPRFLTRDDRRRKSTMMMSRYSSLAVLLPSKVRAGAHPSSSSSFGEKIPQKRRTKRERRLTFEQHRGDIDPAFAIVRLREWLTSLSVDTSRTEFVLTTSMGIGGIVVHDAEELDLVFQIPLGGGGGGGGGRDEDAAMLPVAMRWDAFVRPEYRERTGFSKALGDAFVENQLESKLKGVVIEDDDDDDDAVERRANTFPLDSTRSSMLALALMYQDMKSRLKRRMEEMRKNRGGHEVDEELETELNKYPPHWQAYVDALPTNVDSLLLWSSDELEYLQNSRIGERAKRRKKLVDEEFDVLFSNEDLREEFERLMTQKTTPVEEGKEATLKKRRLMTPFRFETLREWFRWSYATVLARAFVLPEIEDGALLLCPGLDIFNSKRDAAKCEVRFSPHDDISLHATVGGYRAGTQAFHDYADHASGGALLEYGFIYDDDERLNFPLFMDKEKTSPTFIYQGATEIDISATAALRDFLTLQPVYDKCKHLDVLAPSSTRENPILRKFLLSNVTETPWDSSAKTKITRPSTACVSKDLVAIVQTIEHYATPKTTASSLLTRIYELELARYSATSIAEDLTTSLELAAAKASGTAAVSANRRRVALKLRLSEKILLQACANESALKNEEEEDDDDAP